MNSQKNKQNACVHFFRRKGYAIIFLIFSLLVLSQLKHLLNISNLIGNIPIGNVYMDITNNTTIDSQFTGSGEETAYIIAGEMGLNVRTHPNKTSPLVTTLPPGSVVISAPHTSSQSHPPERIAITFPSKGWISLVTPHAHLIPVQSFFPSCLPDAVLSGVKYTMLKTPSSGPVSRHANGHLPPPPPFGSNLPPSTSQLPKFLPVESMTECCHSCARSATCAGWTLINERSCLLREAGIPFKTATGKRVIPK